MASSTVQRVNTDKRNVSFRTQLDTTIELRTDTYLGQEYLVVPVIALVEGVLQGLNAPVPELALSSEFGRVPDGWNGRPVVMNHPTINGQPVSANSPSVLEDYAFGILFNSKVEDSKLKMEAWLDTTRIQELGGEFADIITRLNSGEVIEVSTGLYTGTEEVSGIFNGREYQAIWRNIIPDHLAFLSAGVTGACSVADGAGAPRINQIPSWQEFTMPAVIASETSTITQKQNESSAVDVLSRLIVNTVPANLLSSDIQSLLSSELKKFLGGSCWVFGFTADKVIYEIYSCQRETYIYMQRSFNIADDNTVTFTGEPEEVRLITQIVPASSSEAGLMTQASKETTMAENTEVMTVETSTSEVTQPSTPEVTAIPVVAEAPKPRTMQEFLETLPPDMREVMASGLKLHAAKKSTLITELKASGRCKFPDTQLNTMDLEMLEGLAELARVPSYEGQASPRANAQETDEVPPMPALYPANQAK